MGVMGVMEEQNWRNPAPVEILKSHVKHLCIYIPQCIHIYIYAYLYTNKIQQAQGLESFIFAL